VSLRDELVRRLGEDDAAEVMRMVDAIERRRIREALRRAAETGPWPAQIIFSPPPIRRGR
jgi:hypothetical protein